MMTSLLAARARDHGRKLDNGRSTDAELKQTPSSKSLIILVSISFQGDGKVACFWNVSADGSLDANSGTASNTHITLPNPAYHPCDALHMHENSLQNSW